MAARRVDGIEVSGWDPDEVELAESATRSGLDPMPDLAAAVDGADAVLVAAPVGVLPDLVAAALGLAADGVLVTDVGSTKAGIVAANSDPRFVGGHPLAGAEVGGASHGREDLFIGATWFLTPTESTSGILLERAFRLVSDLGARPRAVDSEVHDRIMATVSHLPHVFANLLVGEAAQTLADEGEPLPATGPSFRDATRVAGAPSSIWADIYLSNAPALAERLASVERELARVRSLLEARDGDGLREWNDLAAERRSALSGEEASGAGVVMLSVSVPNRPGVLAEIALELGRAGIDLADLQLLPAPDMASGTIVLGVEGSEHADRARSLVENLGHAVTSA